MIHQEPLTRQRILGSYQEALDVLGELSSRPVQWDAPTPCPEWSLLDLSGHLLSIARYWHRLLDAVEAGQPASGLPRGRDLAAMNDTDLRSLPEHSGPERLQHFLETAQAHLRRVRDASWETVLGDWSGLGPLTIGQHSGVAIGEWHVHAWDLARSVGRNHRPSDALTVAEGNRIVRDVSLDGDPWLGVLVAYERDPTWEPE